MKSKLVYSINKKLFFNLFKSKTKEEGSVFDLNKANSIVQDKVR